MKRFLPALILLLVVLLTVVFYFLNSKSKYDSSVLAINEESYLQKRSKESNLRLSGSKIADEICIDSSGKGFPLSMLIKDTTLIFYFSEFHCNVCYEEEIRFIQSCFTDNSSPVMIICWYESDTGFKNFSDKNQIQRPIYRIEHELIDLKFDNFGYPYYFLLHPDLIVSDIYIPDKNSPDMNKQYLERIKKLLSE